MYLSKEKQLYLKSFIESNIFKDNIDEASNYWKYYSDSISVKFNNENKIISSGGTGGSRLYRKKHQVFFNTFLTLLLKGEVKLLFKKFFGFFYKRTRKLLRSFKIRKLSFKDGFDAVMNHDPIINPYNSPFRVNHINLKNNYKAVLKNYKEIKSEYSRLTSMELNEKVVMHYYNFNLLQPFIKDEEDQVFLDIGGGNGLLASILTKRYLPKSYFMIDLPSTLMNAFCYLNNCSPNIEITLPQSIKNKEDINKIINREKDNSTHFIFLTPSQIDLIDSNILDLSINTTSFQEMTYEQIENYFNLIERASKNNGLFYCVGRVEKIPQEGSNDELGKPNLFYEYPWNKNHERLINETSRLHTACQYEAVAIRLERVKK